MSQITIQTKFHTIEGQEWGNPQGKPILAFHGWLDNANSFEPIAKYFPDHRFIAVDFPGHGKSSHKPQGALYHFAEYAMDIVSIANGLALENFILLSHSMGAAVSTLVAGTGLLSIEKLILIEAIGPITNPNESAPEILTEAIKQVLHPRGKKETYFPDWELAVAVRMRAGDMTKESVEKLMERGLEKTTKGLKPRRDLRLHYNSFFRLTDDQVVAFCRKITCPTLLILGDKSVYPLAERFTARKEAIQNFKQTILPGGHHLHMDHPEIVAKEILTFLDTKQP
ncbi:alpha/beta fold hydrolase [Leptospira sp. 'Mane']|uniref:alpha/beta fold hydrolase n=1 Tax=Leptospira sp. 'Mane' TaxID=3387407 RepID=UPI00398A8BBF